MWRWIRIAFIISMLYVVLFWSTINVKMIVSSGFFGLVDSILPLYLKIDQCTLTWTAYPVLHLPGGAHCTLRCPQRLCSCGWFEAIHSYQSTWTYVCILGGRLPYPHWIFGSDLDVLNNDLKSGKTTLLLSMWSLRQWNSKQEAFDVTRACTP